MKTSAGGSSAAQKSPSVTAKSEARKTRDSGGGGGGIPRPQLGITTSPSKLAVRTNTSKMVAGVTLPSSGGGGKHHEAVARSASGGDQQQPQQKQDSGPYKLLPPSAAPLTYTGRTLVNDKLYPRIPAPGPPLYPHPSAPQRSQTLSMIPSHSSRTKMGAGQGAGHRVPNMPGRGTT